MAIVVGPENVPQILDRQAAFLADIVALQDLKGIQHRASVANNPGDRVRYLDDARHALSIETKHDAVVWYQRLRAENLQFEAASYSGKFVHYQPSALVVAQ